MVSGYEHYGRLGVLKTFGWFARFALGRGCGLAFGCEYYRTSKLNRMTLGTKYKCCRVEQLYLYAIALLLFRF